MITKTLKENYQCKTLEELIVLRNKKLEKLNEYENKFIFCKPNPLEMLSKPSPHTVYSVDNEDLIVLTELILKKIKNRQNSNTNDSVQEAIENYTNKFGGFPYFLFMGASDQIIINTINEAIKNNKEITLNNLNDEY